MDGAAPAKALASASMEASAMTDASQASAASAPSDLAPGDNIYVVGHGPAVLVAIGAKSRGKKKYFVRYPNGTEYHVASDDILARERPSAPAAPSRAAMCMRSPLPQGPPTPLQGPRRLEYFGRAFDDEERNASTPSAVFSLVATMVGGGVLSLPYAMSQCGLLLGTVLLVASAAASTWTLDMLVDCARATGRGTFELIGHAAFGRQGRTATILLVCTLCWLAIVAYVVLLGDLLVPLLLLVGFDIAHETLRRLTLTGAILLLTPLCCLRSIHALRFLCFTSVASVVMVGGIIAARAADSLGHDHTVVVVLPSQEITSTTVEAHYNLWPRDWAGALYVFPMFGVSFLCHFNALPTHEELRSPTRPRMRRVLGLTMILTSLLYLFIGSAGYLYAGSSTCGNVMLNFELHDPLAILARTAFGAVLMLNVPLVCQPCRNALFRLLSCCGGPRENSPQGSPVSSSRSLPAPSASPSPEARVHVYYREETEGSLLGARARARVDAVDTFLPKDETVQSSAADATTAQRYLLTVVVLGAALLTACTLRSVLVVWSILGSTVCLLVAFILPAAFWHRIMGPVVSAAERRGAMVLVAVSVVLAAVCTVQTFGRLDIPPCPMATLEPRHDRPIHPAFNTTVT